MDLTKKSTPQTRTFDPSNPDYKRRLWVRRRTKQGMMIHIFWRRVMAFLAVSAVAGWFVLALAAMLFVEARHKVDDIRYADVAFPWRWPNYKRTMGKHYLADARTLLANGSYRAALGSLSVGILSVPDDIESRKLLTILQFRFGRPDVAAATIEAGLPYLDKTPAAYDNVLSLLRELQMETTIIDLAKKSLPEKPDTLTIHLYLALQLSLAQCETGQYDACQATVLAWRLDRIAAGQVLLARCRYELGDHKGAIAQLEGAVLRMRNNAELMDALVSLTRQDGDYLRMRHYAVLHYLDDPKDFQPRIDLIYAYAETHDEALLSQEVSKYLTEFATNRKALEALVQVAAAVGRETIAQDTYQIGKRNHFGLQALRLGLIQAAIGSKDYKGALAALNEGKADLGELNPTQQAVISGLKAIAQAGTGDGAGADSTLKSITKDTRYLRAQDALFLAKQMRIAGGTTEAYQLLTIVRDRDPSNAEAIVEIVKADIDAKNHDGLVKNLPALLALKKPEPGLARSALPLLIRPEDAPLRTQIRHLGETPEAAPTTAQ